jgi:hypothetical protein
MPKPTEKTTPTLEQQAEALVRSFVEELRSAGWMPVEAVSAEVLQLRADMQLLVELFTTSERAVGAQGDHDNLRPVQTAIRLIRTLRIEQDLVYQQLVQAQKERGEEKARVAALSSAHEGHVAALRRERDEFEQKGKDLCQTFGHLLVNESKPAICRLYQRTDLGITRGNARCFVCGGFELQHKAALDPPELERVAAAVHDAYLTTCARLGWPAMPANQVPYAELSEESKELDRASVRAVLAAVGGK